MDFHPSPKRKKKFKNQVCAEASTRKVLDSTEKVQHYKTKRTQVSQYKLPIKYPQNENSVIS